MVVQVSRHRGQSRPRRNPRFSILGDGLLERARSTTLALLGAIAAFGLALVAVTLQEGWPLIAGSPVPPGPALHEAVGGATALGAKATPRAARRVPGRPQREVPSHGAGPRHPGGTPVAGVPSAPSEFVSSPATPAGSPSAGAHGGVAHGAPAPQQAPSATPQQAPSATPQQAPPAAPTASSVPAPEPPASSPPAEAPAPEATTPEVTASESGVPPWSSGHGHAYGRDEGEEHGHGHH
jgi:hypothetical protein